MEPVEDVRRICWGGDGGEEDGSGEVSIPSDEVGRMEEGDTVRGRSVMLVAT